MDKEWLNHMWEEYRRENRLLFEFTTPYAHQQNSTIEQSMCTVLDGVCSMIAESEIPLKYWTETTQAVIYMQNFVPSSRRPRCIPAELWHGKQQDVLYLHLFGTIVYAHIPSELNLSKLYPRSAKVSLLGYFGHNITSQANFPWKIIFDTLYTNRFSIRICSRTLSISSECNTI